MPSLLGFIPHALLTIIFGALAVPLFWYADRQVGGDNPHPKSTGYGRVFLYAALALVIGLVTLGEMAMIWIGYRSLPWKVGGSMTPRTTAEKVASFARHALPGVCLAALCFAHGNGILAPEIRPIAAFPFLVFAAYATSLSLTFTRAADNAGSSAILAAVNADIEHRRGAGYGFAMLALSALSQG